MRNIISNTHNLLLMSSMGIGDFIMFTPVLRNLKLQYPALKIDVSYTHKSEKMFWDKCPYINKSIPLLPPYFKFKMDSLEGRSNNLLKIVAHTIVYIFNWFWFDIKIFFSRYNFVITHFNCSNRPDVALASFFSFSKIRIGYKNSKAYKNYWDFLYNRRIEIKDKLRFIDMNLQILEILPVEILKKQPEIFFDEDDKRIANHFIDIKFKYVKPLIIIAPGVSFFKKKQWAYKNFAEVANILSENDEFNIVVAGTSIDEQILNFTNKNIASSINKLSLGQFIALVSLSSLVICCEGGVMHIADALKKNTVAIYGPQNRLWATPYHKDKVKMIYKNVDCYPCNDFRGHAKMKKCDNARCINGISVKDVMSEVRKVMDSGSLHE